MKVFVAVLFVAFVASAQALTEEQKAKLVGHHKFCLEKTEVKVELVEQMRAGKFTEDETLKSYARCMFERLEFMNSEGEIQIEVIKAKIPADVNRDEAMAVIEKCKDIKEVTPEGTAYNMYKCYRQSAVNLVSF